jgi:hypothetical protein
MRALSEESKCRSATMIYLPTYPITVVCFLPNGHTGEHCGYAGIPVSRGAPDWLRRVWWPEGEVG